MVKKLFVFLGFCLGLLFFVGLGTMQAQAADSYVKEAENAKFVLYTNPKTLAIKVQNKASGYTWQSSMDDLTNQGLNGSWQQFVDSALTIDYLNNFDKARTANLSTGSQVSLSPVTDGFQANISFNMAGIRLSMTVVLTDTGFEVKIPHSGITESTMGRLVDLNLYPFLGATKQDSVKGYMLIPDGSGAEISYQGSTQMTSAYQQNYYDNDVGLRNTVGSNPVTVPVYGIVNGSDALLSYVKSGAEYGQLNATKAGLQTAFNWITSKFIYRASYQQPTSQADTAGVQMYQSIANPVNIDVKYDLLSGEQASAPGLAQALQHELVSQGILHKQTTPAPIMDLYFLGAATKPGLFWPTLSVFTRASDLTKQIQSLGLSKIYWELDDWSHGGYDNVAPNPFPADGAVGSTADFQELTKAAQSMSSNFALDLYYGSTGKNDAQPAGVKHAKNAQDITGQTEQAVAPQAFPEMIQRDLPSLKQLAVKNVGLSVIGSFLYSDWQNKSKPVTRTDAMAYQTQALSDLTKAGLSLQLTFPNLYAWKYTNQIYFPSTDSSYVWETATVPFLQMVLHGYINYTSDQANSASDPTSFKLQNIATGTIPYIALTLSPSSALAKTSAANYYNTEYANWKGQIKSDYKDYAKVAAATQGATITDYQTAGSQTRTSYSNGTVITVDFAAGTYKIEGGPTK